MELEVVGDLRLFRINSEAEQSYGVEDGNSSPCIWPIVLGLLADFGRDFKAIAAVGRGDDGLLFLICDPDGMGDGDFLGEGRGNGNFFDFFFRGPKAGGVRDLDVR
jgi:hypothetical protein